MYSKPVQNVHDKSSNEFVSFGPEQLEPVQLGEVAVTYAGLNAMSNRVARAIVAARIARERGGSR
jgi:hypothetical protein